jgi:hypothetical protein
MEFKRIVVLANSIKHGARCVAGIEFGNRRKMGRAGWIRPVSGESEGELEPRHTKVEGDSSLKLLDVVDVPLRRYAKDAIHPEDWIVDTAHKWKPAGTLHPIALNGLEEKPKNLWLESAAHTDRATGAFLLGSSSHQSLYLVRPVGFRVELSFEHNPFKDKDKKKTRAKFMYCGQEYEMSLTDPDFIHLYCTSFPAIGAKASLVRPPYGDNCLLCVSLTPEFNGYHNKVVAAVLELR